MNSVVGPVNEAVILPDGIDNTVVEPEHKNHILNVTKWIALKCTYLVYKILKLPKTVVP